MNTTLASLNAHPEILEALDVATERGTRPFAEHVSVTGNRWHGVDIRNLNSNILIRLAVDDNRFLLHLFDRHECLVGSVTCTGNMTFSMGNTLRSLL